jgi:hypothetical protein
MQQKIMLASMNSSSKKEELSDHQLQKKSKRLLEQ